MVTSQPLLSVKLPSELLQVVGATPSFSSVLSVPPWPIPVLSPFPATHTKIAPVTPLAATDTKSPSRKSFPCHTSEKTGGGGILWLTTHPAPASSSQSAAPIFTATFPSMV